MNESRSAAPLPLGRRIIYTFVSPRRLIPEFRRGTRWLDVLVLSTIVAILSVYLLPQEFFVEQMRDAVNRRGAPVDIVSSPGEIARWGRYLGMLTALVSHPLFALALAGLLSLLFTVLASGTASFRDHLAISSHAFLITALGSLLAPALQWLTGRPDAHFTPSLFLPSSDSLLWIIVGGLDLFTVWMLAVVALWAGSLNPRVGPLRAALVLLGLYLLLNVVTALLVS